MTFLSGEKPVCSGQPSPIVGLTVNTNNACVFSHHFDSEGSIYSSNNQQMPQEVCWRGMHQVQIVPSTLLFAGHNN